jgi:hypothetical protein
MFIEVIGLDVFFCIAIRNFASIERNPDLHVLIESCAMGKEPVSAMISGHVYHAAIK